jgi:hypothetical protein
MDHHFRAFSFVDRITAIEPGVRISGRPQLHHAGKAIISRA